MIKTNKNINYGAALTRLLEGYNFAQEKANSEDEYKYPNAYGRLQSAVKGLFLACTDKYPEELNQKSATPKAPEGYPEAPTLLLYDALHWEDEPNDIPDELFSKPNIHP
jgi:hypothetical protein